MKYLTWQVPRRNQTDVLKLLFVEYPIGNQFVMKFKLEKQQIIPFEQL